MVRTVKAVGDGAEIAGSLVGTLTITGRAPEAYGPITVLDAPLFPQPLISVSVNAAIVWPKSGWI